MLSFIVARGLQIYNADSIDPLSKMFKFNNTECWTLCWERNCHPFLAELSTSPASLVIYLVLFNYLNNMHGQQFNNPLQGAYPRETLSHVYHVPGYSSHSF